MKTAFLISATVLSIICRAQDANTATKDSIFYNKQAKPHITVGLGFMSDEVYSAQRIDSFAQWGLHPSVLLFVGKGWSLEYHGSIWSKNNPKYALSTVGVNKEFSIGSSFYGAVGYYHWFINDPVRNAEKEFNQNIETNASYSFGHFSAGLFSMFMFGNSFSSLYSPSVSWNKELWIGKKKDIKYDARITALAGFGNYDAGSIPFTTTARGSNGTKGKGKKNRNATTTTSSKTFGLLNYEIQLGQDLHFSNCNFGLDINLAIPNGNVNNTSSTVLPYLSLTYSLDLYFKKQ